MKLLFPLILILLSACNIETPSSASTPEYFDYCKKAQIATIQEKNIAKGVQYYEKALNYSRNYNDSADIYMNLFHSLMSLERYSYVEEIIPKMFGIDILDLKELYTDYNYCFLYTKWEKYDLAIIYGNRLKNFIKKSNNPDDYEKQRTQTDWNLIISYIQIDNLSALNELYPNIDYTLKLNQIVYKGKKMRLDSFMADPEIDW